jgi:SAM-dependent methyltransferase
MTSASAVQTMTHIEPGLVADESEFMARHLPLRGARIVELGCGKADLARRLLQSHGVAQVTAFEVDQRQHAANLAAPPVDGLRFAAGGAQDTGLPSACCDGVMMLKSLHHVPLPLLDDAIDEVARILKPGGWFYVSEPVYAGAFNEVVKVFHDEGEVRAAAYAALQRARDRGRLSWEREIVFDTALHFQDFDDFVRRIVQVTHTNMRWGGEVERETRERFQRHMTASGARFVRQMRINILRKPPA